MLKGSPQGGVLSPFLFNLVIDGLLHDINILQPDSLQGFADDLVATLADTDPFALHSKAQRHIDHIYSWCLTSGLSINTLKTKIIIFTNKRSFSIPPLVIAGTNIPYSKETTGCPKSHCAKVWAYCSACDHLICKISSGMFQKSSSFEEFNGFGGGAHPLFPLNAAAAFAILPQ